MPMPPAAPVIRTVCMISPLRMWSASAGGELAGEPLIALAAVEQMPAHRRARLRDRAGTDRLHDVAMFLLEGFAVDALGHARTAADRLPRDDEAAKMFEKPPELRVAGRVGDAAMEREILIDAIGAPPDRGADGIEAVDDLADLRRRGPFRGEPGGFYFDAGAQLHDVEHRAQRREPVEGDAQRRTGIFRDERADALARDDEAVRAQGGNRLPHHRAAHAGGGDQFLLGRQARPP